MYDTSRVTDCDKVKVFKVLTIERTISHNSFRLCRSARRHGRGDKNGDEIGFPIAGAVSQFISLRFPKVDLAFLTVANATPRQARRENINTRRRQVSRTKFRDDRTIPGSSMRRL